MRRGLIVRWVALMIGLAAHAAAQSADKPRFEVASVKPSASDPLAFPRSSPPSPGRFTALDATLRVLILLAYGNDFRDSQIVGGPDWLTSRRFDIQAKAEDAAASREAMFPMLRTLLEERFQLKVHTETREMPLWALVVARDDRRLGPNVKSSTTDCSNPAPLTGADVAALLRAGRAAPCVIMPGTSPVAGGTTLRGNGVSMEALAASLSGATRQVVHDRTGLSGLYDWELTFERPGRGVASAPSTSDSPALTTALQEQLGLKLESTRGPVEVLVIDSAALPGPD